MDYAGRSSDGEHSRVLNKKRYALIRKSLVTAVLLSALGCMVFLGDLSAGNPHDQWLAAYFAAAGTFITLMAGLTLFGLILMF
jgi:hypothetical protein